jgi:hypothetical protein
MHRNLYTINNAQEIIRGFSNLGFPQTLGAIDGTHIPIISLGENSSDYYNRKDYYSVVLQAIVNFMNYRTHSGFTRSKQSSQSSKIYLRT